MISPKKNQFNLFSFALSLFSLQFSFLPPDFLFQFFFRFIVEFWDIFRHRCSAGMGFQRLHTALALAHPGADCCISTADSTGMPHKDVHAFLFKV